MRDELMFHRVRRLAKHPGMPHAVSDPRFASVASSALLGQVVAGEVRGQPPADEVRATLARATAIVVRLDEMAQWFLEEQVESLLNAVVARHAVSSVLAVTGWAGGTPQGTSVVAAREGITAAGMATQVWLARGALPVRPWLPALDAAGEVLAALAPAPVPAAAAALRDAGLTDRWYSPAAILDLAAHVDCGWELTIADTATGPQLLTSAGAALLRDEAARETATRRAVVAALRYDRMMPLPDLARRLDGAVGVQRIVDVVGVEPELVLLPGGWVGSYGPTRISAFEHILARVFAVAPELTLSALLDGLARGMAMRSLPWRVPERVVRAYLAGRPGVDLDRDVVRCLKAPPLTVLPPCEAALVEVLRASPTRALPASELVAAYAAGGRSRGAARTLLKRSPVLEPVSYGVYKVRGELVHDPQPPRPSRQRARDAARRS